MKSHQNVLILIKPTIDRREQGYWDACSALVHGISLDELLRDGRSVEDVVPLLEHLFHDRTLVADASNRDLHWLAQLGQEMLADPEIGPQFILPLKMQGIQDVTETAIVCRFKFTAKPGNPSHLQREALKRIIAAMRERGIQLASNAVTVRGGDAIEVGAASGVAARPLADATLAEARTL